MPARPEPAPDPLAQLSLAPLRNAAARVVSDQPDRLVLELDAAYPRWLGPLPRLVGAKKHRRYALDGLGLELYRLIDDRRPLGDLIEALALAEQLTFNEARLLALHWLHHLAVKGLVILGRRQDQPFSG